MSDDPAKRDLELIHTACGGLARNRVRNATQPGLPPARGSLPTQPAPPAAPLQSPGRPVLPAGRSPAWPTISHRQKYSSSTRAMTFEALT
ncbi:hypothetical protein ABZ023_30820 [Streptomyces sp. NPDC006367]|uniref:hypothetical protein n=1 Tax=unclassified Streptomyces TaxID=2593676 RepID=UPI0033A41733